MPRYCIVFCYMIPSTWWPQCPARRSRRRRRCWWTLRSTSSSSSRSRSSRVAWCFFQWTTTKDTIVFCDLKYIWLKTKWLPAVPHSQFRILLFLCIPPESESWWRLKRKFCTFDDITLFCLRGRVPGRSWEVWNLKRMSCQKKIVVSFSLQLALSDTI